MEFRAIPFSLLLFLLLQSHKLLLSLSCNLNSTKPHRHHKPVGPTGRRVIVVDASGTGDFLSVQDAVNSIPENNTVRCILQINAGYYMYNSRLYYTQSVTLVRTVLKQTIDHVYCLSCGREKVVVPATKPYITFQGSGKDETVIEWHDRAGDRGPNGQQLRTYHTASVTVLSNFFIARNISFKNSVPAPLPGMEGWQAVAFRISGDKAYFSGCGFYGAQDTLCDDAGRHYFKNCYIEGSIDFIFGNGRSMYKDCQLHSVANRFGSIAAQGRGSPCERTGFIFVSCRVTGTGKLYVGRAMGRYSRIVFAYTYFENVVTEDGWDDWGRTDTKKETVFFGVYRCWGPGAEAVSSASWTKQLNYKAARPFLAKSFVNGRHWITPWDA